MTESPRIIDYMCSAFLPDRAAVWDDALASQGIPLKIRRNPDDSFCELRPWSRAWTSSATSRSSCRPATSPTTARCSSTTRSRTASTRWPRSPTRSPDASTQTGPSTPSSAWPGCAGARGAGQRRGWPGCGSTRTASTAASITATTTRTTRSAAEFGVPVVMQAGRERRPHAERVRAPIGIDRPAIYFRDVRFVLSHTGNPWEAEAVNMALKFPNVYLGACALSAQALAAGAAHVPARPGRAR